MKAVLTDTFYYDFDAKFKHLLEKKQFYLKTNTELAEFMSDLAEVAFNAQTYELSEINELVKTLINVRFDGYEKHHCGSEVIMDQLSKTPYKEPILLNEIITKESHLLRF